MKRICKYGFVLVFLFLMGCKTMTKVEYVPVESVRTEYRDNYARDSIFLYDSVYVKDKGDTVWLEKYKYLYKDKLIRDSIFINDTIPVPVLVNVPGPQVNFITGWQNFQIWCGRILLSILGVMGGWAFVKYRKKLF